MLERFSKKDVPNSNIIVAPYLFPLPTHLFFIFQCSFVQTFTTFQISLSHTFLPRKEVSGYFLNIFTYIFWLPRLLISSSWKSHCPIFTLSYSLDFSIPLIFLFRFCDFFDFFSWFLIPNFFYISFLNSKFLSGGLLKKRHFDILLLEIALSPTKDAR
jgi:hypothetical protein